MLGQFSTAYACGMMMEVWVEHGGWLPLVAAGVFIIWHAIDAVRYEEKSKA